MTVKTVKPIPNLEAKVMLSTLATYFCFTALLFLFSLWGFLRESGHSLAIWCIQSLPLLLLLPGMFKKYYRSYSWLCFVLLFYFVKGVEGSMMSNADILDHLFLILTVLLFISSMMASRWLQRLSLKIHTNEGNQ